MNLKPHQVDLIITSGPVRDEFAQKVKELDRRLKMNGMDYKQWDTLTDHQHEIFTDNLFLDGECAASPENYVRGAVDSCWCPDVVEDLHHHSPVLMREIEKQQEMAPDMTVKISESLSFLNEFIDREIKNLSNTALITESERTALYEQQVVKALIDAGIEGGMHTSGKTIGDDENGPDADFIIPGMKKEFLEIKADQLAQMAEARVYYNPNGDGTGLFESGGDFDAPKFGIYKPERFDSVVKEVAFGALKQLEPLINQFATALIDPRSSASSAWVEDSSKNALFNTTGQAWDTAKAAGKLKAAGGGYGKGKVTLTVPQSVLDSIYNTKKDPMYYIQIGEGAGLYYMGSDPLGLAAIGVPRMNTEFKIILRARGSSRKKVPASEKYMKQGYDLEPQLDSQGNIKYITDNKGKKVKWKKSKGWGKDPQGFAYLPVYKTTTDKKAENPSPFVRYTGVYALTPKINKTMAPSPWTLDEVEGPRGIKAMLAALAATKQEPEQPQVEPEESEET